MAGLGQHHAVLLGQVEVTLPMSDMSEKERIVVARMCHNAIVSGCKEPGLQNVLVSNKRVKVYLDQGTIKVLLCNHLVSRHKVAGLIFMAAVSGTSGRLVYIGQCQEQQQRLAVILDLGSEDEANQLIQEFLAVKEESSELSSVTSCDSMVACRPPSITHNYRKTLLVMQDLPLNHRGTTGHPKATEDSPYVRCEENEDLYSVIRGNFRPVTQPQLQSRTLPSAPPLPGEGSHAHVLQHLYSDSSDDSHEQVPAPPGIRAPASTEDEDQNASLLYIDKKLRRLFPADNIYDFIGPDPDDVDCWSSDGTEYELQIEDPYENLQSFVRYQKEEQQVTQVSQQALLSDFLRNEFEYLHSIQRLRNAKRFLPPQLQHLLRVTEALASAHSDMYEELYEGHKSLSRVAQVFISRKDQLERYKYHLMNVPKATHCMDKLPESVKHMFPKLKEDLFSSWRRLHYYFMTLQTIMESAPAESKAVTQEAIDMLHDLYRQGDAGILIDAVKGAPFDLHQRAPLLLQNSFSISSVALKKPKVNKYHVLLFSEMIVVTLPKNGKYDFKTGLRVEQLYFLSLKSDMEFILEVTLGGERRPEKYTFRARSKGVKEKWVQEISRLIRGFAEKSKCMMKKRYGLE